MFGTPGIVILAAGQVEREELIQQTNARPARTQVPAFLPREAARETSGVTDAHLTALAHRTPFAPGSVLT
jgi:hypothetical protein